MKYIHKTTIIIIFKLFLIFLVGCDDVGSDSTSMKNTSIICTDDYENGQSYFRMKDVDLYAVYDDLMGFVYYADEYVTDHKFLGVPIYQDFPSYNEDGNMRYRLSQAFFDLMNRQTINIYSQIEQNWDRTWLPVQDNRVYVYFSSVCLEKKSTTRRIKMMYISYLASDLASDLTSDNQ